MTHAWGLGLGTEETPGSICQGEPGTDPTGAEITELIWKNDIEPDSLLGSELELNSELK